MSIQEQAEKARRFFVQSTRDGKENYWHTVDAPQWVQDMCMDAHGDMLPDDWRYGFIVEALDALEENEDADEARDSLEADIYTHELTGWLHSRADRAGYVDDAVEEFGGPQSGIVSMIQWGQLAEKWEVFDSVRAYLENVLVESE